MNRPKKFYANLGINIFVLPDIILWCLHFSCCTGKENGANGRIKREHYLVSKLKWVITHRNWAILRGYNDWILIDKSVLAPVQLIRSVPSLLSSDRERYEMTSY